MEELNDVKQENDFHQQSFHEESFAQGLLPPEEDMWAEAGMAYDPEGFPEDDTIAEQLESVGEEEAQEVVEPNIFGDLVEVHDIRCNEKKARTELLGTFSDGGTRWVTTGKNGKMLRTTAAFAYKKINHEKWLHVKYRTRITTIRAIKKRHRLAKEQMGKAVKESKDAAILMEGSSASSASNGNWNPNLGDNGAIDTFEVPAAQIIPLNPKEDDDYPTLYIPPNHTIANPSFQSIIRIINVHKKNVEIEIETYNPVLKTFKTVSNDDDILIPIEIDLSKLKEDGPKEVPMSLKWWQKGKKPKREADCKMQFIRVFLGNE